MIDGLDADVVTLALAGDIDAIAQERQEDPADWQKRAAQQSSPYTSTIVFLVRKGNPKGIKDWDDLVKPGVAGDHAQSEDLGRRALELSRGLGLWARSKFGGDEAKTKDFVAAIYKNVPVLDTGARGSTMTFAAARPRRRAARLGERGLSGARGIRRRQVRDRRCRRSSILAEPPVAVVDANVDAKGTRKVAEAYLEYPLFADGAGDHRQATTIVRRKPDRVPAEDLAKLPAKIKLITIDDRFSAAGRRRSRSISPTAAFSTRSTSRPSRLSMPTATSLTHLLRATAARSALQQRRASFRASDLALRLYACLSRPDRPDSARGAGPGAGRVGLADSGVRVATEPRVAASLRADFGVSLSRRSSMSSSARSSPGCWRATAFPAAESSTPWSICPSRCRRRWPASRWPRSMRRTAGSARSLAPLGIKVAYTPLGIVVALVFIGLPFVVRTVQPVMAEIDRGARGGRRHAWRQPVADDLHGCCCPPPGAGHRSPASPSPSPAPSANTAR